VLGAGAPPPLVAPLLDNVATLTRRSALASVNHYDVVPVFDIYANVQDRDMGSVAADMQAVLDSLTPTLPRGTTLTLRGQAAAMRTAYEGLAGGLVLAVVLVYLIMVINFQSWTDPLIIASALPVALAGVVWALFATGDGLSVPAFMGAIMSMGVATANGILVVSFANELVAEGAAPDEAVEEGCLTRLRPVLMTALAMVVGMIPMALGLGEGGEQNAPLGRAVIGGLTFATMATLTVLPLVYALVRTRRARRRGASSAPLAAPAA